MKNALLALALFALVGTAAAHDHEGKADKKGKKGAKKEACAMAGQAGSCCAHKGAKTTAAKADLPAATQPLKSL